MMIKTRVVVEMFMESREMYRRPNVFTVATKRESV
jgi:hypothetical protein